MNIQVKISTRLLALRYLDFCNVLHICFKVSRPSLLIESTDSMIKQCDFIIIHRLARMRMYMLDCQKHKFRAVIYKICLVHLRPNIACLVCAIQTAAYCSCLRSISACIVMSRHRYIVQARAVAAWLQFLSGILGAKATKGYCRQDFAGLTTKT